MRRLAILVGVVWLAACAAPARADDRGWRYLIEKLVADGVDREQVEAAFHDLRVAPFAGLELSPNRPRESRSIYRRFLRPASIAAARSCRRAHADAFDAAERVHGVSADLVAAIFFVESRCGRNTGSNLVLYRLARLAMANEPDNLDRNIERVRKDLNQWGSNAEARLRARARYLEETFYPEVRAVFAVADRMGVGALDIRGSRSGAFGYPQFLPTSYLTFGVDADGDGRVSLYNTDDAAASCAYYFAGHGWRPGLKASQRRAAVWQYNRSDAYVDTVLTLAARIGAPLTAARRGGKRSHPTRHASHAKTSKHLRSTHQ